MSGTLIARQDYAGGGIPVVIPLQAQFCNTQISLVGCDSSNTTIELMGQGATSYDTITVASTTHVIIIEKTLLANLRITVVAGGSYIINVWQFPT